RQDGLAVVERERARERVLDLAERARADAAVFGERLLLLCGAHLHLALQRPAGKKWRDDRRSGAPHGIVAVLEHEELARDAADRGGEGDARQARRLRLLDAVERRRHTPLGGDHVRPALEELRGHADRDRTGERDEPRGHLNRRSRIAPGERLERAQRLLVGKVEAAHAVAEGREVRFRKRHVVLVAAAYTQAVLREGELLLRGPGHFLGDRFLQARLGGEEPALRDERRERLARVL